MNIQRAPGQVDSRLRGNDKWEGGGRLSTAVVRTPILSSRA